MEIALLTTHILTVFHLDDDPFQLDRVHAALEKNAVDGEFKVTSFESPKELLEQMRQCPAPDIVILDIHVDERSDGGITVAKEVRRLSEASIILMCSNADDVKTITKCLAAGADDFISKHSDRGELSLRVLNSYHLAQSKRGKSAEGKQGLEASRLRPQVAGGTFDGIASRMPRLLSSAVTTIHVAGESGVGKEVVADLLGAQLSSTQPFIKVNCAAISPALMESELFGHVKGSFTGATTDRRGYFESADGGWIFLDEVATLTPSAQAAMLRAIENQEILRVGSAKTIAVRVRVLSASNEPLDELVAKGRFRKDLWQRLCEIEIKIPPLRERKSEIPALISHFIATMPNGPYQITTPAAEMLSDLNWAQGNVRELRNCLRAMTEYHVDKLLTPLAIPARVLSQQDAAEEPLQASDGSPVTGGQVSFTVEFTPLEKFEDAEDRLLLGAIEWLVQRHGGKVSLRGLSRDLGIARSSLSDRCRRLSVKGLISFEKLAQMVNIVDG